MLRASVEETGASLDPRAITDPTVDPLLTGGRELLVFIDGVLTDDPRVAELGKEVERVLGGHGLVDAAGVIGNFQMMNRIADATGIPVGKGSLARTEEWRQLTGMDRLFDRS